MQAYNIQVSFLFVPALTVVGFVGHSNLTQNVISCTGIITGTINSFLSSIPYHTVQTHLGGSTRRLPTPRRTTTETIQRKICLFYLFIFRVPVRYITANRLADKTAKFWPTGGLRKRQSRARRQPEWQSPFQVATKKFVHISIFIPERKESFVISAEIGMRRLCLPINFNWSRMNLPYQCLS